MITWSDTKSRWELRIRQSTLDSLRNCPEQVRRGLLDPLMRGNTDATSLGTGVHAMIAADLRLELTSEAHGLEIMAESFHSEMAEPGARWVQNDEAGCFKIMANAMEAWFRLPLRDELLDAAGRDELRVEEGFEVDLFELESTLLPLPDGGLGPVTAVLAGTIDLLWPKANRLFDWKTANRPKAPNELQKWGIQPTCYSYASTALGWCDMPQWTYVVFPKLKTKTPEVQVFDTVRGAADHEWLLRQIRSMIPQMLMSTEHAWPMHDDTWLCSAAWCAAWDTCKGQFIAGNVKAISLTRTP